MSYARLIESLMRHGPPGDSRHAISWKWAADTVEHPDFDIPGVLSTSPTGRVMLVVEGERELVGKVIEKAIEVAEAAATEVITR